MKKYLIIAAAFVAGFAFTGCKNENVNPTVQRTILLAEQELELSVGESYRLNYTISPVDANVTYTVNFASSNAAVATVGASGIVEGIAEGEANIIVTSDGATGDTCHVTVSNTAVYNSFNIADYGLFGEFEPIEGTDTTLTLSIGKVKCQLANITLIAWDGNLVYSNKSWSGAGLAIQGTASFYIITEGDYEGYYIGAGGFIFTDLEGKVGHGAGQAGSVNVEDYGEFLKGYIVAETSEEVNWELLETAFPGAQIIYVDCSDAENPRWSDMYGQYYGHVEYCNFYDADEKAGTDAAWALQMQWHDFIDDDRYFGMKVTLDEEGHLASVVEPYDFKAVERTFYSENWEDVTSASEAHKMQLMSPATLNKEVPAFAKKLATDRLYKK